jgi:hypothetical protein
MPSHNNNNNKTSTATLHSQRIAKPAIHTQQMDITLKASISNAVEEL